MLSIEQPLFQPQNTSLRALPFWCSCALQPSERSHLSRGRCSEPAEAPWRDRVGGEPGLRVHSSEKRLTLRHGLGRKSGIGTSLRYWAQKDWGESPGLGTGHSKIGGKVRDWD
eukprot:2807025-Pleurochrysis_carterae.AAC.3